MPEYEFKSDPRLVLELARKRLETQLSAAQVLESKIATLFAAGSALIGLLAAVLAFQENGLGKPEAVVLSIDVVFYAIAAASMLIAIWPRDWDVGPSVSWAWKQSQTVGEEQFLPELISGYMDNWRNNQKYNKRKTCALWAAVLAVFGQTLCLIATLVIVS